MTNDGNAILREIEVAHPAAKSMVELSRTQDEEVGDGTTSVIILGKLDLSNPKVYLIPLLMAGPVNLVMSLLSFFSLFFFFFFSLSAGEMLAQALPHVQRNVHPIVIISAMKKALEDALQVIDDISVPVDVDNQEEMLNLVKSSLGTKFVSRWSDLMCKLALDAVRTVAMEDEATGQREVDIKRYARVEKIPGGEIEESKVLDGLILNKDVTHPKMRRRIENPRVVLLDCPLEYKKGESQTNIEITKEADWNRILEIEEEQVKAMCEKIIELKPDLVFTEKGVSGG